MAYIRESFIFAFREGLEALATDRRCGGQDYKVLLYLLAHLEWGNQIRCVQKDMALALNISKQATWRSLQRLVEHGILLRGPKHGHQSTFQLNDAIGYYGPLSRQRKERQQVIARQRLEHLAETLAASPDLDVTTIVGQQGQLRVPAAAAREPAPCARLGSAARQANRPT